MDVLIDPHVPAGLPDPDVALVLLPKPQLAPSPSVELFTVDDLLFGVLATDWFTPSRLADSKHRVGSALNS